MSRMLRQIAVAATIATGLAIGAAYADDTPMTEPGGPGTGNGVMGHHGMMGHHGGMQGMSSMMDMMDRCSDMMQGMGGAPNDQWREPTQPPDKG